MKKLFFALAVLASFSANALVRVDAKEAVSVNQEKQYKKINVSDIPKDVLGKIKKQYGNYTIKEAHKADDGEYKLILSKDGVDNTATFTSAGELIKIY